jgi:hypothetical protein
MIKKRLVAASRDPLQLSNQSLMTLPDERYRAVKYAQDFLLRLVGEQYARVPKAVRDEARSILRHYPMEWDMRKAAQTSPDIFQEQMEDLHRFVLQGQQQEQKD